MAMKRLPYNQLSRTGQFYRDNPSAVKKKDKLSKEINARPGQIKKRVESNSKSCPDGKDYDHATDKCVPIPINRGRPGEGGRGSKYPDYPNKNNKKNK